MNQKEVNRMLKSLLDSTVDVLQAIIDNVDDNLGGWIIIGYVVTMGTMLGFMMHLVINGLIRLFSMF